MCVKGSWPGAFLLSSRGRKAWHAEHGSQMESKTHFLLIRILRDKCCNGGQGWLSERPELEEERACGEE